MDTVLSGLSRDACRAAVGPDFQFDGATVWMPGDALASLVDEASVTRVVWFYRSPACEGDDTSGPARFARWMEANRAALNLRRVLRDRLVYVNVDRVAPGWLDSLLGRSDRGSAPEAAGGPDAAPAVEGTPHRDIAEYLLAWGAPECWSVYQALELVSSGSGGPPPDPFSATPATDAVFDAVAVLTSPPAAGGSPTAVAAVPAVAPEPAGQDAFLRDHLLDLQEEVERYYKKSADAALSESRARKERDGLRAENEALRQQLQQIMDQMVSLATRAPASAAVEAPPRSIARRVASYVPRRLHARRERALRLAERASHLAALRDSGLLDAAWYRETYPDVGASGIDPGEHYLDFGWREGRNPGPGFDTRYYLKQYPDVLASGINPLLHYVSHGRDEGRSARPA